MELFKRLIVEEDGQGLVEYTLIVLLVALVFWVAIKDTNIGSTLSTTQRWQITMLVSHADKLSPAVAAALAAVR